MEEKEPVNGSEGGGEVKVIEEHTHGGSEGSQESKTSNMSIVEGGKRETIGSVVSPSLDGIVAPDPRDDSKGEGSMSAKNKKRIKERERKKAKRDKAVKDKMSMKDEDSDPDNSDDDSTVVSSSSNRSRKEDADRIRELEAMVKALTAMNKPRRRDSVSEVAVQLNNKMMYSATEVTDDMKLKVANGHTLLELFMRIDDARNVGHQMQTIAYLSVGVKSELL